ncbi:hypothetical protein R3P38DRAFT_2803522 [Favolaschia claudopus]|uniref:Uncharacterized protein n=1 Tax=Favolaschia claudopus TaxID=2862362 RepID=A0AAV9ZTJ9_9AGAR
MTVSRQSGFGQGCGRRKFLKPSEGQPTLTKWTHWEGLETLWLVYLLEKLRKRTVDEELSEELPQPKPVLQLHVCQRPPELLRPKLAASNRTLKLLLQSISPVKKPFQLPFGPSVEESPAASRTRGAALRGKPIDFQSIPTIYRNSKLSATSSNSQPLQPVTTLETAHASPSPQAIPRVPEFLLPKTEPLTTVLEQSLQPGREDEEIMSTRTVPVATGNIPRSGLDPVETLLEEYESTDNEEVSLYLRVTSIANKHTLDKSEIVDRGVHVNPQVLSRFGLSASYMLMVARTIRQMQSLLKKMAALNPARTSTFFIDPEGVLLSVLTSSKNIGDLLAAWTALSRRMDLAQGNLAKYHSEARVELETLQSPTSTALEVYEHLPHGVEPVKTVEYLYNNVPHLQDLRPSNYDPRNQAFETMMDVPKDLKDAFPPREPEARPVTIFYSNEVMERVMTSMHPPNMACRPGDIHFSPSQIVLDLQRPLNGDLKLKGSKEK